MSDSLPINLVGLDRQAIETWFVEHKQKAFHGRNVLKWIHKHGVLDFAAMTDIGKKLRIELTTKTVAQVPRIVLEQTAKDGTCKWLLELACGNRIETVYIPDTDRSTLCISSQVGCALNCQFCSTARQGFNRNLDVAEIVGQVWVAIRRLSNSQHANKQLTNVVLMGMGEPLANFANVVNAINILQDDLTYGLSKYKITLSTVGLVPALRRLRTVSDINLAVSLHAPNDELRNQLVPINRKYPIAALLDACREFIAGDKRRKVTFEYVMLDGVNDTDTHLRQLVRIMQTLPSKVNLIPFNVFPDTTFRCSPNHRIEEFRQRLLQGGIMTMTRKTRGNDIDVACGQLVGQINNRACRQLCASNTVSVPL
ncbi:ribosomal RNA large subunit methyltransferase N [Achromatium sp. WMS1]|nr:ribosomal RNA large subunit methyltransferase N [Achromatium sp. WMS1]